jgi:phosphonate degradation associated HDIG domain protein
MTPARHPILDEIETLFAAHGDATYGEGVTMRAHSLQTAALALAEGAPDTLVVAALLHDVGHFLELADDEYGYHRHDQSGGAWLATRFPASVSEPVRLHVTAKRYLCAVEPGYHDRLSYASQHSLRKQGGPMTEEEAAEFGRHPFVTEAVRLRQWDDGGKIGDLEVPTLESHRARIAALLAS